MRLNLNMKSGFVQTRGTCWFYSSVNAMMLSRLGRRVLFKYMIEYFNKLNRADKFQFFSEARTCRRDPTKNLLYFYIFMFRFWAMNIQYRFANSPNLVRNVLPDLSVDEATRGRYPNTEREKMFKKMGITFNHATRVGENTKYNTEDLFILRDVDGRYTFMPKEIKIDIGNYAIDNCILRIARPGPTKYDSHRTHVIAGVTEPETGKRYIFDSNNQKFEIDWTKSSSVLKILEIPYYKNLGYDSIEYDCITYVNTEGLPAFDTKLFRAVSPLIVSPSPPPIKKTVAKKKKTSPVKKTVSPPLGLNTKGRQIYKGARGGLYVLQGAKKLYKFKTSPVKKSPLKKKSPPLGLNKKGRQILKGPRGGLYVLEGTKKIYK